MSALEKQGSDDLQIVGINWPTTLFLAVSLAIALVATPLYVFQFGVGPFEIVLFLCMFVFCGMSITVGYHRLFSHCSYRATWPVRLFTALFGAGAFESSILVWCSEHRYHHRFTDEDGDPHDPHSIRRGFFWAHVGWLLVYSRPELRDDNVADLRRDPIVVFQDRFYLWVASAMGFVLPMLVGLLWSELGTASLFQGLAAGFLFGGCTRIVLLQHATFLINSAAHTIGVRPYDAESSARDSTFLAFFTFGEGYHNYHHAFQADFRNGVRKWHWDPGKWVIWSLSRIGLASNLRRIPKETVELARIRAKQVRTERHLNDRPAVSRLGHLLAEVGKLQQSIEDAHLKVRRLLVEERRAKRRVRSERQCSAARRDWKTVRAQLRGQRREFRRLTGSWRRVHRRLRAAVA